MTDSSPTCDSYTRRAVLAVTGGLVVGGCSAPGDAASSGQLPILVGLAVENDTDSEHEYDLRVRYASDREATPQSTFERSESLGARQRQEIDGDWPNEPGQYAVEISVDGGEWRANDVTDRLTQSDRICYRQAVSIRGADEVTFFTDLDAPCPE